MENQPTFEEFDHTLSELIHTIKYMKYDNMFDNFYERILALLDRLFDREYAFDVNNSQANVDVVFYILIGIILLVMIILVIRILRGHKKDKVIVDILGEEITEESSVLNFREKGEICRLNGQYREATRLQFIAILFHLHQSNILYHDQTMTGSEMVNTLTKEKFIAIGSFALLVKMFNSTWYGSDSIEVEDYNNWSKVEKKFWMEVQK